VRVLLAENGETILARLSAVHCEGLRRMESALGLPIWHDEPHRASSDRYRIDGFDIPLPHRRMRALAHIPGDRLCCRPSAI
jgi:hypothetical protein